MVNVFILGGSKNIGYYSGLRLLAKGNTVTFLLRKPDTFDNDAEIQKYIKAGKVRIAQGDALIKEDVRRAWGVAKEGGNVDFVLSSIGGVPSFKASKGFIQTPENLVSKSILNLISTYPTTQQPPPKLIVVTSNGLTHKSHAALPFLLKPMYGYMLAGPHEDKLGVERVLFHASGWTWPRDQEEPKTNILEADWKNETNGGGWLKDLVILRPALFTDGECKGDANLKGGKAAYRAGEEDMKGAWTISRKDTAHFVVEGLIQDWATWNGKAVTVAY